MLKKKDFLHDENFVVEKNFNHFSICSRQYFSLAIRKLLQNPDDYLDDTSNQFFKNDAGDTTTVGVVNVDSRQIVVKRYNIKSWWHFIKKCWCKSRAFHSWQSSFYLKQNDIETIEPIAVIEKRFGFLRSKSYFISEYVAAVRGCDYFGANAIPTYKWKMVIEPITTMIQKLYRAHIRHHDFQYGNMLITVDKVLLLDLDHMKIYNKNSWFFRRAFNKDINHFLAFLASNPDAQKMFQEAFGKNKLEVDSR